MLVANGADNFFILDGSDFIKKKKKKKKKKFGSYKRHSGHGPIFSILGR